MDVKQMNASEIFFDYDQELARSGFADMLHDTERNHKYALALKEAIETMKMRGRKANVLDIGTGSGLLAMLASKYGADSVTTVETYGPVSNIAREIIARNGFADKIKIVAKHSRAVIVGVDLEQKANILVAELFDTDLIGEAAIPTYNEVHMMLMEKDCICVPASAKVFVQVVESDLAASWYTFKPFYVDGVNVLQAPREVLHCSGVGALNDLQLSQLPLKEFKAVTSPLQVTQFDFTGRQLIQQTETFVTEFKANEDAKSTTIFFWWELSMNSSGSISLSCAPHWAHPDTNLLSGESPNEIVRRNCLPWRDHWMQACFHIQDKALKKGRTYYLRTQHDEFSWSFRVFHSPNGITNKSFERSGCLCNYHYNSKNTVLQLNDDTRRHALVELLKKCKKMKNVLFIGDHSVLPLVAAKLGIAEKIFVYQERSLLFESLNSFIEVNGLAPIVENFELLENLSSPITDLICDPNFETAVNPIANIAEFFKILRKLDLKQVNIHPRQVTVYAIPVNFLHLHKIRWPLQSTCEGFDHSILDAALEKASKIADSNVEPFSLWEYPSFALGAPTSVFSFTITDEKGPAMNTVSELKIEDFSKSCNGIAFWIEWKFDTDIVLSSGPKSPKSDELVNWKFDRQAVHLIPHQHVAELKGAQIQFAFDQNFEDIKFNFAYQH